MNDTNQTQGAAFGGEYANIAAAHTPPPPHLRAPDASSGESGVDLTLASARAVAPSRLLLAPTDHRVKPALTVQLVRRALDYGFDASLIVHGRVRVRRCFGFAGGDAAAGPFVESSRRPRS